MKISSFLSYSLCLLTMTMGSEAFIGSTTSRNKDLLFGTTRTTPKTDSAVITTPPQATSFSRMQSKHPLFATSGVNHHRSERRSLKSKLQIAFIHLFRRASQLGRNVRLLLAILMTTCMLQFGGPALSPVPPAHAAKTATTTVSSRPRTKRVESDEKTASKKEAASKLDRQKTRTVIGVGFGASLYSVLTTRNRGVGNGAEDEEEKETPINGSDEPTMEVIESTAMEKKIEEEVTVETTPTITEESPMISSESVSSSTTLDEKTGDKEEEENPIVEFLDTIGANPDIVFGFLGSALSFVVSEDLLISGITFAWILKLFKESEEPDYDDFDDDDDDDDESEDEEMTEEIEDYRPEEIMTEISPVAEEVEETSPSVPEEESSIEEVAIDHPTITNGAEEVGEDSKEDDSEEMPQPVELVAETSVASEESTENVAIDHPTIANSAEEAGEDSKEDNSEEMPQPVELVAETSVASEESAENVEETSPCVPQEEEKKEEEASLDVAIDHTAVASDTEEIGEDSKVVDTTKIVSEEVEEVEVTTEYPAVSEEETMDKVEEISSLVVEDDEEEESVDLAMDHSVEANGVEETVEHSARSASGKISIREMAYKVVMDLGLIEWESNKRDKN